MSAALLEIGELGDLQSVEQHLPADAPCAECGRFPVVFFEANIVFLQVDSDGGEAFQIKVLNVRGRWLKYYLKLRVLVEAVGIFAVAAVGGTAARLGVDDAIRLRPEHAQKSFGMHGAGADFDVIRLLQNTIAVRPILFKS